MWVIFILVQVEYSWMRLSRVMRTTLFGNIIWIIMGKRMDFLSENFLFTTPGKSMKARLKNKRMLWRKRVCLGFSHKPSEVAWHRYIHRLCSDNPRPAKEPAIVESLFLVGQLLLNMRPAMERLMSPVSFRWRKLYCSTSTYEFHQFVLLIILYFTFIMKRDFTGWECTLG